MILGPLFMVFLGGVFSVCVSLCLSVCVSVSVWLSVIGGSHTLHTEAIAHSGVNSLHLGPAPSQFPCPTTLSSEHHGAQAEHQSHKGSGKGSGQEGSCKGSQGEAREQKVWQLPAEFPYHMPIIGAGSYAAMT